MWIQAIRKYLKIVCQILNNQFEMLERISILSRDAERKLPWNPTNSFSITNIYIYLLQKKRKPKSAKRNMPKIHIGFCKGWQEQLRKASLIFDRIISGSDFPMGLLRWRLF